VVQVALLERQLLLVRVLLLVLALQLVQAQAQVQVPRLLPWYLLLQQSLRSTS
jgi:hypothetical protein